MRSGKIWTRAGRLVLLVENVRRRSGCVAHRDHRPKPGRSIGFVVGESDEPTGVPPHSRLFHDEEWETLARGETARRTEPSPTTSGFSARPTYSQTIIHAVDGGWRAPNSCEVKQ